MWVSRMPDASAGIGSGIGGLWAGAAQAANAASQAALDVAEKVGDIT